MLVKLASPARRSIDAHAYFDAFFDKGTKPSGDAPGEIVGGVSTAEAGWQRRTSSSTLEPGHYGYLSAESDDDDVDDTTKGLIGEFDVS